MIARLGLGVIVVAVLGATFLVGRSSAGATQQRSAPPAATMAPTLAPTTVVALPGDTLWRIAGRVAPAADRRVTVERLVRLNRVPGGSVRPGQVLIVSAGSR